MRPHFGTPRARVDNRLTARQPVNAHVQKAADDGAQYGSEADEQPERRGVGDRLSVHRELPVLSSAAVRSACRQERSK